MSNVLSEEKKQQVIALGRLGWSLRRIQQATRIRRETAAGYLKAAGIPHPAAGRMGAESGQCGGKTGHRGDHRPCGRKATRSAYARSGAASRAAVPSSSACEPYRELIELGLSRGRNAMAIWQDLVDDHGFTGRYDSVKRFVRKLRGVTTPEARVVIETAPGEEAQVDYGDGPMVRDPQTGKYRRTRLFVLTLGYSRKSVRLLVFRSSTQIWAELHEKAFRRLGGATRVVVLDNLREGVLTPDIYDPTLNPLYRDVLKHYGAVALPCRVHDPDRKGKVESGVGHAQKTPLKGLRFETAEEAQAYLDHWEERWADTRIHGTTKRQVAAMFAEEKPALLAAARRTVPLLPVRRAHRASGRLRRSGSRLLQRAARLDRPPCAGAVGCLACPPARSLDRATAARAPAPAARPSSHPRRRSSVADPAVHAAAAGACEKAGQHIGAFCQACIASTAKSRCAASWACSRWPRSTASRPPTTPAPWPWKPARANTTSCAVIWSTIRNCR